MSRHIIKTKFSKNVSESVSVGKIISSVINMPRLKIDREMFLRTEFNNSEEIIEKGPVAAGCSREELKEKATEILNRRASELKLAPDTESSELSEDMNLPKEILHFYSVALQFAQEIAYLYGEQDMWKAAKNNTADVNKQLALYCAVMLGYTGASQTVRVLATSLKKELKRKVLSKVVYYPVIKTAAKVLGKDVTTDDISEGVSQIPAMGDEFSEGMSVYSLETRGMVLIDSFDKACFDYSEEEI